MSTGILFTDWYHHNNNIKNAVQYYPCVNRIVIFFFFLPSFLRLNGLLGILLILILRRRILILLILRHQIIHITLRLSEFHFVHALTREPVQERPAAEHFRELVLHAAEELLDGCRVSNESRRHLEARRRH